VIKNTIFFLLIILVLLSCSTGFEPGVKNICRQEPCYEGPFEPPWVSGHDVGLDYWDELGKNISHDNRVLETKNILTFSDASSDDVKIWYARVAETAFEQLKKFFNISSSAELGIVDRYSKITIYSDRYKQHQQSAKEFGFILWALDNPRFHEVRDDPEFRKRYQQIVKHEMTHVFQFYLGGRYHRVDCWFTEGVAEWACNYLIIQTWEQVEEWRQHPDHELNPIAVKFREQVKPDGTYYPMYGLAVQYLMDKDGWGKTALDVKAIFQDVGRGILFEDAFENHMDLPLQYYEENFYKLIKEYLSS